MTHNQLGFIGGLAAQFDGVRPDPFTYRLLINGRVRTNVVEPILAPLRDTLIPDGNYQNITAIGSVLLMFISGECWYRDVSTANGWRRVAALALDPNVAEVDTAEVPSSTLNYKREGSIENVRFSNSPARTTSEGILATDGVTQPALIYPEIGGTIGARTTQTYAQWTETETGELREYVPVGRHPLFVGQKLYMAIKGPAGNLNRIAQSVSGRPLDFVVAINDTTGDKDGDALVTAHAVGFDEITGMYKTAGTDAFIPTTLRGTFGVTPDFTDRRFFGEPALRNLPLFPAGVINNHSAVDLNGNSAYISPSGIHSFNATRQLQSESNNDPVSRQIHRLLAPSQTYGATADFQDYAFFAVETLYGPGVLVFDKTLRSDSEIGKFVSIDLYATIGRVKQFAKVSTPTGDRLFFITVDNRLYEFGAASTRETCRFYIGDWNDASAGVVQRFRRAQAVFTNVHEATTVQVTPYVDNVALPSTVKDLEPGIVTSAPVIPLPFKASSGPSAGLIHHGVEDMRVGFSVGALLTWNTSAKLAFVTLDTDSVTQNPSQLSQGFVSSAPTIVNDFVFVGDTAPGAVLNAIMKLPTNTIVVGLGDYFYGASPAADYAAYQTTLQQLMSANRFYAIEGNHDVDVDSGLYFRTYFGRGKRRDNYRFGNTELFFYNVGWNTAGLGGGSSPFEPDGYSASSVQARLLRAAMAQSTARFKFVILHYPPYSSGSYSPGYSALRLAFRSWGATAVICGHDHSYQRHIVDGLNYITCGTGGHSLTPLASTKQAGYQNGRSAYGYLYMKMNTYDANISHIGIDGSEFDAHVIYP